jgi:hypothetical protein
MPLYVHTTMTSLLTPPSICFVFLIMSFFLTALQRRMPGTAAAASVKVCLRVGLVSSQDQAPSEKESPQRILRVNIDEATDLFIPREYINTTETPQKLTITGISVPGIPFQHHTVVTLSNPNSLIISPGHGVSCRTLLLSSVREHASGQVDLVGRQPIAASMVMVKFKSTEAVTMAQIVEQHNHRTNAVTTLTSGVSVDVPFTSAVSSADPSVTHPPPDIAMAESSTFASNPGALPLVTVAAPVVHNRWCFAMILSMNRAFKQEFNTAGTHV